MKKSILLFLVLLSVVLFSNPLMASGKKPMTDPTVATNKVDKTDEIPAEIQLMLNRLEEIKAMDKSSLSSSEKKELRAELRDIKSTVKAKGYGLYISGGALIVILLLILLL